MISPEEVKKLREKTGAGIMDCKRALESSGGDVEKAIVWLREQGLATAAKKASRAAREGVIASYVHHGDRLGVLVELNCETDFVARTDDFQKLARDLAIQVAGTAPRYVGRDDIPAEELERQRRAFTEEAEREDRPADRVPEIVDGKLTKWYEAVCLMDQAFRDTDRKVSELITEKVAILGENIRVARFARMAVGEGAPPDEEAA